ncbi:MAG: DUF4402 domain-containing protein [Alphaproteobacteria bacterium]
MHKTYKLKLMILASAAMIAMPIAAFAANTSVPVTATFRTAVSISPTATLAFGNIDFSGADVTAGSVTIPTTGSASAVAPFSLGTGTRNAGSATVSGDSGEAITLTCSSAVTLTAGSETINVTPVTYEWPGEAAASCTGAPVSITTSLTGSDLVKFGGTIDGSTASNAATFAPGVYSGAIVVDVVYQ